MTRTRLAQRSLWSALVIPLNTLTSLILVSVTTSALLSGVWLRPASGAPGPVRSSEQAPRRSLDLKSKLGLAFVSAPLDVQGLSVNWGLTAHLFNELIIGASWRSTDTGSQQVTFGSALGIHAKLLQTTERSKIGQAALTLGFRGHLYLSDACETEGCDPQTAELQEQLLISIPIRIYWFPIPNLSIHSELNTSFYWDSLEAMTQSRGESRISLFERSGELGRLGLTFWF